MAAYVPDGERGRSADWSTCKGRMARRPSRGCHHSNRPAPWFVPRPRGHRDGCTQLRPRGCERDRCHGCERLPVRGQCRLRSCSAKACAGLSRERHSAEHRSASAQPVLVERGTRVTVWATAKDAEPSALPGLQRTELSGRRRPTASIERSGDWSRGRAPAMVCFIPNTAAALLSQGGSECSPERRSASPPVAARSPASRPGRR